MAAILVIDAHPNADSLCSALARRYVEGARQAGADVQVLTLRELRFDPVLHKGYQGDQPLEPDLQRAQAMILDCEHLCLVTPLWWGSVPALLKGFFDRTLQRGWAFRYLDSGNPLGLLAGRSARVLLTTDSPGWYLRWLQGDPTVKQLVRSTLRFCGFKPVRATRFGPVRVSTPQARSGWLQQAADTGAQDAALPGGRAQRPAAATNGNTLASARRSGST
ncbi:MAG TPA: NAD(P)H-dependent oxidoreductase [Ottowia sp.]|nr:NAD(P)H-dependent oxidoreductase [Ottowia sp.]